MKQNFLNYYTINVFVNKIIIIKTINVMFVLLMLKLVKLIIVVMELNNKMNNVTIGIIIIEMDVQINVY